jgi:glyoxylase-like metal-dependent hydrolase (beta-lactamase superfamily II)
MKQHSRRDFLKSSAVAFSSSAAAAQKPAARPRVRGLEGGRLERLSDNLYLFRDTCNVFLLKNGDRALLVDFGSGAVLDHLGEAGVTKVEWLLHTHHHRDQCQGDRRAAEARIPIAVPSHERHYFADAENFWRNRRIFHLYYVRNDFFTVTENIPVERDLRDYDVFSWGPYELFVLPTPGHTLGSQTLLAQVDGKKVAFSGDLVHSPGKVTDLFSLQYNYGALDGADMAIHSLARLREAGAALVCPSHGEPFANPDAGLAELAEKLRNWCYSYGTKNLTAENRLQPVSPHLVAGVTTTSSFYAILSDSGKALFIDYGSASGNFFTSFMNATAVNDRIRFVEHSIPELKSRYGMKSIDVAMPSHMHDDHLNGFPFLQRHHGTRIWCYQNMKDVLQHPRHYNLGCILGEPIKVERTFQNEEKFRWEEYEFTVTHGPGHTDYQMALFSTIDGRRTGFTGDNWFPAPAGADFQIRHNMIFRNHIESADHLKSIERVLREEPEWLAPGHGAPFRVTRPMLEATRVRMAEQKKIFEGLIAAEDTNYGLDPSWASIYPYQLTGRRGGSLSLEVRVRNYRARPARLAASLHLPAGWQARPEEARFEVPPMALGSASFTVTLPRDWPEHKPRVAIAADVTCDGQYLGQLAEGVVDIS